MAFGVMLVTAIGYFYPRVRRQQLDHSGLVVFISRPEPGLIVLLVEPRRGAGEHAQRHRHGLQARAHLLVHHRDGLRL
ncbi:MAG: hypothetical protein ACLTSX_01855 [Collinsella sp.]